MSQPCALWMTRALMVFSISSSEKFMEFNLASVSKLTVPGKELLLVIDLSAKNLLK